jgi:hypothetical protein
MTQDSPEQRRHKRYGVRGCTVQYKTKNLFGLFHKVSEKYMVLDISLGGINFISKEEFKHLAQISLNITAPFLKDPLTAQGRVVRVKASPELHIYSIGIEFVNLSRDDHARLKHLVDNSVMDKIKVSDSVHLNKIDKL